MAKRKKEEEEAEILVEEGDTSRVYELGFHIDPNVPQEEVKKVYETIHESIASKGAIVAEAEPYLIRLAYTISRQETTGRRDFDSAYFAWIVYETSAANHAEIIGMAHGESKIIRFVDLVTTKEVARNAAELHEMQLKAQEERRAAEQAEKEVGEEEVELDEVPKDVEV